jgi:type I restriction enzyme, S subunit
MDSGEWKMSDDKHAQSFILNFPLIPPGYKQTEVGVIPEDWDVKSVHDLATIKTGPFGTLLKASEYSEGDGVPLISVGEIRAGFLKITDQTPRVPEGVIRRLPQYVLKKGDIVFGRKGGVDRSALIRQQQAGWFLGSDGISVRPSKDCYGEYLVLQFQSARVKGWLIQNAIGTTMPSLNQEILRNVVVPLPPTKAEQEAIAEALSDADALIEALEQLIAKKREIKQGAMQELLRPKDGCQPVRLSDIADPNQRWSFTGGPFGSNLKSSDYTDEGVRIIQLQNIGDGEFKNDYEVYTSSRKADELLSCNIYPGEIILSKMGDPVARACIIPAYHERYLMCSDGIRLAIDQKKFNTYFVHTLINAPDFRTKAANAGTGSTRKRIGLTELRNLELLCPPLPEQTAIAAILSDMDAEIVALEAKLAKARQLKQGMMQELLTGRIRLV